MNRNPLNEPLPPLDSLLETLGLLINQARAYERILPPDNYPARAAVAVLSELARKALNEAETLAETFAKEEKTGHPFSSREFQILSLAAHGLTNKEIAYRLAISDRTVQFHMNSIFNKTGTSTRTEAVAQAFLKQWLTEDKNRST
jgi:DNA-binding NarL/FixJ family response regulator